MSSYGPPWLSFALKPRGRVQRIIIWQPAVDDMTALWGGYDRMPGRAAVVFTPANASDRARPAFWQSQPDRHCQAPAQKRKKKQVMELLGSVAAELRGFLSNTGVSTAKRQMLQKLPAFSF